MYFVVSEGPHPLDREIQSYRLDEKERRDVFVETQRSKGCVVFVYEGILTKEEEK